MTGATGDLTPDEIQRDFEPGEWRESLDAAHADVTQAQGARAPAQSGEVGDPGGDLQAGGLTELAGRESGYGSEHGLSPDDPAYRMEVHPREGAEPTPERATRIGGDELTDRDDHF